MNINTNGEVYELLDLKSELEIVATDLRPIKKAFEQKLSEEAIKPMVIKVIDNLVGHMQVIDNKFSSNATSAVLSDLIEIKTCLDNPNNFNEIEGRISNVLDRIKNNNA